MPKFDPMTGELIVEETPKKSHKTAIIVSIIVGVLVLIGILAFGYGKTQGFPHNRRLFSDVASYQGVMPYCFIHGVNACLLAPTAQNKQDFHIEGIDHEVSIHCADSIFMKKI